MAITTVSTSREAAGPSASATRAEPCKWALVPPGTGNCKDWATKVKAASIPMVGTRRSISSD